MDAVSCHVGVLSQIEDGKAKATGESLSTAELIDRFLGSAHVFALAVSGILEERLLRETAGSRLTSSQLKVLRLVSQFEAQTVSDVAVFLGVSNAAASKTVDRLVRRKFLRRSQVEADRRSSELALTDAGRRLLKEYETARKRKLEKTFRQFPTAQLRETSELLDHLAAAIVTQSANPEEVCLQCSVYLRQRCLLQEVVRRSCSYRQRLNRNEAVPGGGKAKE